MDSWLAHFLAAEDLPPDFARTMARVCEPLAEQIACAAQTTSWTTVVGLCGAQGSGKSTIAAVTAHLLEARGLSVAVLSLDDFYLPHVQRQDLARRVHPLLATRGVPGTHDISLSLRVMSALAGQGEVSLPRFDKGRDDRGPISDWRLVTAPVDVVLLEGWCVGARPQAQKDLVAPVNDLEREFDPDGIWRTFANTALAGPYQDLFGRIDLLVLLQAPGFETVLGWRREQEAKLRARLAKEGSKPGRTMSNAEIGRFIAHYERLTRWILEEMPARADVVVRLDADRRPQI